MRLRDLFEDRTPNVVAIMPGGFHPFHPGHKSLYDYAVQEFGRDNVYVAATNDTTSRPFPFDVKKQLAELAGIPSNRFIQVKSPFNALSYNSLLQDANNTALVFIRSDKDKTSQPLPDQVRKSDGNMGYLISYDGSLDHGADTHGYMVYGPTIDFKFSGASVKSASELRTQWPQLSQEEKLAASEAMYPGNGEVASNMLDTALGVKNLQPVESIAEATLEMPKKIKPIKMSNPPKAPDATIPRSRDGHTKSDGTMYKQDKYNDNIMHVSNGGGTYTFDGSRLIRWKTPKINGYSQIHDFIKSTINVDANTSVTTKNPGPGTSTTVVDSNAVYDLKGNLIDKGELGVRYGGLGVSQSDKNLKINYNISPNLSMHIVADRKPVTPKVKQSMDAIVKSPNKDGTASNLIKIPMMAKKAGAKVIFKNSQGQSVPYDQAIAMMKKGKP